MNINSRIMLIEFRRLLSNSESFSQTTFAFKLHVDAAERSDRKIVKGVVEFDDVLVSAVRFFFASAEVKLAATG
jgi:hypothetical protein